MKVETPVSQYVIGQENVASWRHLWMTD